MSLHESSTRGERTPIKPRPGPEAPSCGEKYELEAEGEREGKEPGHLDEPSQPVDARSSASSQYSSASSMVSKARALGPVTTCSISWPIRSLSMRPPGLMPPKTSLMPRGGEGAAQVEEAGTRGGGVEAVDGCEVEEDKLGGRRVRRLVPACRHVAHDGGWHHDRRHHVFHDLRRANATPSKRGQQAWQVQQVQQAQQARQAHQPIPSPHPITPSHHPINCINRINHINHPHHPSNPAALATSSQRRCSRGNVT